jgi:DNA-binding protein H-NS
MKKTQTKTYAQLVKQIDTLSRQAEAIKRQEKDGVIARIKEAIAVYELSASDLGLTGARAARRTRVAGATRGTKRKAGRTRGDAVVKFRDEAGNTWGGRGPRPRWLREALQAGKRLEEFAVN